MKSTRLRGKLGFSLVYFAIVLSVLVLNGCTSNTQSASTTSPAETLYFNIANTKEDHRITGVVGVQTGPQSPSYFVLIKNENEKYSVLESYAAKMSILEQLVGKEITIYARKVRENLFLLTDLVKSSQTEKVFQNQPH